jgi:sugar phosphate isomerase/epimerase
MTGPAARFAVCEIVLRQGSFAADVALTMAAGVAALGVSADAVGAVGVDEARRILDGEGVLASSYMGLETILQGGTDDIARQLDAAAVLGAPGALVLTGPLGDRTPAEADAECRDWLERAAALAVGCGIRIMLEPVHPLIRRLSYVHTMTHALELVDGIDGAGVVLDVGNVWWEHGLDRLIGEHVDDIDTVQLTNVDSAALDELRYERAPLDSGDVPVASLVRALGAAGYGGWYEYEVLVRTRRDERLGMLRGERAWFEDVVGG